ncbi:MAG TPA: NAD(P)H-binding protein [Polyangia bacterium]|nr:NAD(P)H-binding protein [Polyangia bacterium]
MPTAFIAGATGYTGRALMEVFARDKSEWKPRPHARSAGKLAAEDTVVCDPRDVTALTDGMRGCDAVVQLIGTVKARFAEGDYDAIDYGTTVALGEAAKAAGVPRLLLLSSVGAGTARGKYLAVKRKTEEWVERSGLEYTIVRPSMIAGEGRRAAQVLGALMYPIPSLRGIEVHELARVFLRALERPDEVRNKILEGKSIWKLLEE